MPYYKYHGARAGFAAFQRHVGRFIPPPVIEEHASELKAYQAAKGTVRLPVDRPLPAELVGRLVKARVQKNEAARRKKGRR